MDKEENDEIEDAVQNNVSNDDPTDAAESDNDISFASLAGVSNQASSNYQGQANNEQLNVYIVGEREYISF